MFPKMLYEGFHDQFSSQKCLYDFTKKLITNFFMYYHRVFSSSSTVAERFSKSKEEYLKLSETGTEPLIYTQETIGPIADPWGTPRAIFIV